MMIQRIQVTNLTLSDLKTRYNLQEVKDVQFIPVLTVHITQLYDLAG
jgi:hypothetical protein